MTGKLRRAAAPLLSELLRSLAGVRTAQAELVQGHIQSLIHRQSVAAGRTALIITHRFTTAMFADVIHVMEAGRYAAGWTLLP